MAREDYFEPFYLQEFIEKPSPFPPPFDEPIFEFGDGKPIVGQFVQNQSKEVQQAATIDMKTVGRFTCGRDIEIETGSTLRRVSDSSYFRLTALPKIGQQRAITQVQAWVAIETDRGTEERTERAVRGLE